MTLSDIRKRINEEAKKGNHTVKLPRRLSDEEFKKLSKTYHVLFHGFGRYTFRKPGSISSHFDVEDAIKHMKEKKLSIEDALVFTVGDKRKEIQEYIRVLKFKNEVPS